MTLTDARRTLLDYRKGVIVTSWSLNEAIDLAIKVLPSDPPRPTCEERFRQIAEAVRVQYDIKPFATRNREKAVAYKAGEFQEMLSKFRVGDKVMIIMAKS